MGFEAPIIRTTATSNVRRFRGLRFWAENGAICIVRESDGKFETASIREFLYRAKALNDQLGHEKYRDEKNELQNAVEDMCLVAKEAQQQGDLFSPRVTLEKMRARGRKVTVGPPRPHTINGRPLHGSVLGRPLPSIDIP